MTESKPDKSDTAGNLKFWTSGPLLTVTKGTWELQDLHMAPEDVEKIWKRGEVPSTVTIGKCVVTEVINPETGEKLEIWATAKNTLEVTRGTCGLTDLYLAPEEPDLKK